MAIDPRIALGIQQPQMPNMLEMYGQAENLKLARQRNKLADLAFAEKEREAQRTQGLRDLYRDAVGPDGKLDRHKVITAAAQGGYGDQIPVMEKGFAEQDKARYEADAKQYESSRVKLEFLGQVAGTAKDQASYESAVRVLQANNYDTSQIPPQYDPAAVAQFQQMALSAQKQLDQQWESKKFEFEGQKFGETKRHNRQQEALTARGQNMTDARAREFNAAKVEENAAKRDEKRATTDLTKNSQIASFDTMLGTLDRLAKHKGLPRSVGLIGALPTMPGSESANFQAELNTFQSQAFVPMVSQLKGMGALSDAEGKKLTAAVGALDPTMGEEAFRESIKRITDDLEAARERVAGARRDGRAGAQPAPKNGAPEVGTIEGGYRFKGGDPSVASNWEKQ